MNVDDVTPIEGSSVQTLEKALKHLPEPDRVHVHMFGQFDYSSLHTQVQELYPRISLKNGLEDVAKLSLHNPTKQQIIDIYRRQIEIGDNPALRIKKLRRLHFDKAEWSTGVTKIELTPFHLKAAYTASQPEFLTKTIEELADTGFPVEITIMNYADKRYFVGFSD